MVALIRRLGFLGLCFMGLSHASRASARVTIQNLTKLKDPPSNYRERNKLYEMDILPFFKMLAAEPIPLTEGAQKLFNEYELRVEDFMRPLRKRVNLDYLKRLLVFLDSEFRKPQIHPAVLWAWFSWSGSQPPDFNRFYYTWFKNTPPGTVSVWALELAFQRILRSVEKYRTGVLRDFVSFAEREKKMSHLLLLYLDVRLRSRLRNARVMETILSRASPSTLETLIAYQFETLISSDTQRGVFDASLLMLLLQKMEGLTKSGLMDQDEAIELRRLIISRIRFFQLDSTATRDSRIATARARSLDKVVDELTRQAGRLERQDLANQLFTLGASRYWNFALDRYLDAADAEEVEFLISARMKNDWAFRHPESLKSIDRKMDPVSQRIFALRLLEKKWGKEANEEVIQHCPNFLAKYKDVNRHLNLQTTGVHSQINFEP